jgi:hypothetical protein
MTGRDRRTVVLVVIQVVAGVLLVLAATIMPWATYENLINHQTTTFRGGDFAVLRNVGVGTIAISLLSLARPRRVLGWLQLGFGVVGFVVAIVIALDRISEANHVVQTGASRTSYQPGAPLAIVASAAIVVTALVALTRDPKQLSA